MLIKILMNASLLRRCAGGTLKTVLTLMGLTSVPVNQALTTSVTTRLTVLSVSIVSIIMLFTMRHEKYESSTDLSK